MAEKVVMGTKEQETVVSLNELLGLGVSKENLSKREDIKKILLAAWKKPNTEIHSMGIPRRRIIIMTSRLAGFQYYILKRKKSIENVLKG